MKAKLELPANMTVIVVALPAGCVVIRGHVAVSPARRSVAADIAAASSSVAGKASVAHSLKEGDNGRVLGV